MLGCNVGDDFVVNNFLEPVDPIGGFDLVFRGGERKCRYGMMRQRGQDWLGRPGKGLEAAHKVGLMVELVALALGSAATALVSGFGVDSVKAGRAASAVLEILQVFGGCFLPGGLPQG